MIEPYPTSQDQQGVVRPVSLDDAEAIRLIYNHFVLNTTVTFEEEEVGVDEMRNRITAIISKYPWLVYEKDGKIAGYAYASPWKTRAAYRYAVECTIYLAPGYEGHGIGSVLYPAVFEALQHLPVHAVIGGIAQPNEASMALHRKCGFEQIAHFKKVGYKFNKWVDVIYFEMFINSTIDYKI